MTSRIQTNDNYDENFVESNQDYKKRSRSVKDLTPHRKSEARIKEDSSDETSDESFLNDSGCEDDEEESKASV